MYGAEIGTLRTVDQQYVGSFEMWCWRRMEISWTDRVRNKEVSLLHRDKEERNHLHKVKRRRAIQIGQALRRNCLLDHVIEESLEGKMEVTERRGRRRNQLLHDLKEKRIRQVRSPLQRDCCTLSHLMLPRFRYPLVSLRSSSSCLCILPHIAVASVLPSIFPSVSCFRRQFLRKM